MIHGNNIVEQLEDVPHGEEELQCAEMNHKNVVGPHKPIKTDFYVNCRSV